MNIHAEWDTIIVSRLVCLTAVSAQTGYIVPYEYELYHVGPGTRQTHHKTVKQYTKMEKVIGTLRPGLCGDNSLRRKGFLREVFLANHLASTDKLTRTTKIQNTYQRKLTLAQQEAQLMLTTGSTRLAVSRGQQTQYHSTCYI